ncbi:MAG TPA: hypothetical protein VI653_23655 [Steroidobacteraceae bacterium]
MNFSCQDPEREAGTDKATRLMEQITNGDQAVLQPPHWLAEIGAVLARETPDTAADDVTMLSALELPSTDDPSYYDAESNWPHSSSSICLIPSIMPWR